MARYKDSLKNYREEKNRWDSLGKKRSETPEPEQPPLKMFLIAGDNSGTGILENLIEADGVGLICETEADTVSTARLLDERRMQQKYLPFRQHFHFASSSYTCLLRSISFSEEASTSSSAAACMASAWLNS